MSDTYDPTNPHRRPEQDEQPVYTQPYDSPQQSAYVPPQQPQPAAFVPDPLIQQKMDEAVRETQAQHQRAQQQEAPRKQEPPEQRIGRRSDALRDALQLHQSREYVTLPELSRRSVSGPVRLKARRLVLQELAASNLLPVRADELVSKLMDRSLQVSESGRREWGIDSPLSRDDVDEVVDELYGGWNRAAVAAFYEFQCIVCCLAIIDPKYKLVMDWDQVEANPDQCVYVWDIPEEDRQAIYDWVMSSEVQAENTAMPFR